MSRVKKTVNQSVNFLGKQLDNLKEENKKERKDIDKLEKKNKIMAKKQKETADRQSFDIALLSSANMIKFRLRGAVIAYLSFVVFQTLDLVYMIMSAYILSIAMEVIIAFLSRWIPRGVSISLSYLLLIVFLLSGVLFIVPFLITQFAEIASLLIDRLIALENAIQTKGLEGVIADAARVPHYFKETLQISLESKGFVDDLQASIQENLSAFVSTGTAYVRDAGALAVTIVTGFFNVLFNIGLLLTLSVLFSIEKDRVMHFLAELGGHNRRDYIYAKIQKTYKKLGIWLRSQLLLSLYIGVVVRLALTLLGLFGFELPSTGTLAIIAGLTEIIPYLGPTLGMIPALFVAGLAHGFRGLVVVSGLYFVIQWTENNVIIPLLMNKTLGVSPLVIFLSMLSGGLILGFTGIVLAVPISVILTILIDDDFE